MIIAVCIDDKGGMLFNHRRQSQDRLLREDLLTEAAGRPLWMSGYSAKQFAGCSGAVRPSGEFTPRGGGGERCLGGV